VTHHDAVVRRTVTVPLGTDAAFAWFADRLGSWWPPQSTFGRSEFVTAVVERRAGGRWFERTSDGRELTWGTVKRYDPPDRLVVTWQITEKGEPEPDPAKASEVEIRFVPLGERSTRVELEHRGFDHHGARAGEIWRQGMESTQGWDSILGQYVAAAAREARP
jgi:uncharacterized protein YndB with AHSA1/START domain